MSTRVIGAVRAQIATDSNIRKSPCRSVCSRLQQWREAQVRGKCARARVGDGRRVYGLQGSFGVGNGSLVGVVPSLAALVEKSPVACLGGEQLARGALGGVAAQAARERKQDTQLEPPGAPGEIGDRRRVPGAQILRLAPGRGAERLL